MTVETYQENVTIRQDDNGLTAMAVVNFGCVRGERIVSACRSDLTDRSSVHSGRAVRKRKRDRAAGIVDEVRQTGSTRSNHPLMSLTWEERLTLYQP